MILTIFIDLSGKDIRYEKEDVVEFGISDVRLWSIDTI